MTAFELHHGPHRAGLLERHLGDLTDETLGPDRAGIGAVFQPAHQTTVARNLLPAPRHRADQSRARASDFHANHARIDFDFIRRLRRHHGPGRRGRDSRCDPILVGDGRVRRNGMGGPFQRAIGPKCQWPRLHGHRLAATGAQRKRGFSGMTPTRPRHPPARAWNRRRRAILQPTQRGRITRGHRRRHGFRRADGSGQRGHSGGQGCIADKFAAGDWGHKGKLKTAANGPTHRTGRPAARVGRPSRSPHSVRPLRGSSGCAHRRRARSPWPRLRLHTGRRRVH